ncbi:unnamed protein product [Rotaria socialis]|uniref:VWFA domain-containing protein n=1 Tax=Rotaria socialis TaxID=392032 RepID=A0A821DSD7_9BILA|nr:unnamed protein product [Rotaria socialis]
MQHQYHNSLVLIVLLIIGSSISKTVDEIFVDELMRNYDASEAIVPGAAVIIICNGKQIFRQSYGFADIETDIETTPVTNFRLASLTKQFTAAAVLLLAEEQSGRLQLDDLIRRKWFPTLPLATDAITIRHLLTHTSGLIDYEEVLVPDTDLNNQLHDSDVLDILIAENRTHFSPAGSRYRYSNSGYALLALIVEQASGKRFADFLYERIFQPLEMHGTIAFENGISTVMHRAFGYSGNSSSWARTDQDQTSAVLGDGGIYSSIDDLLKWDAALYDNRLLSSESLRLAFTPATMTDEPGIQYGMGWKITGDMGTECTLSNGRLQFRAYSNPITNLSLDAFFVVDTSSTNLNLVEFGQMKSVLRDIMDDLTLGSVRLAILFYGSKTAVDIVHTPTNETESIGRIKTKIQQKQFRRKNMQNPSTLNMALAEVERICNKSCRHIFIPHVTLLLTSAKQPEVYKIQSRRLDLVLRMTVITVGIGNQVNRTALSFVASESFTYAISLDSFTSLIISAQHISSLVSSVAPALYYKDSYPAKILWQQRSAFVQYYLVRCNSPDRSHRHTQF